MNTLVLSVALLAGVAEAPTDRPASRPEVAAEAQRALLSGEIQSRHLATYGVQVPLRPEHLWRDTPPAQAR